jgi:hypothetical protein
MCFKVRGRAGTEEPKETRKHDGEQGDGVGKIFPSPKSLQPLAEFHSQDIDFPSNASLETYNPRLRSSAMAAWTAATL